MMSMGRGRDGDADGDAYMDACRKGGAMPIEMHLEEGGLGMPIGIPLGRRKDAYGNANRMGEGYA